jgi:predicted nucleic acid-binding protein
MAVNEANGALFIDTNILVYANVQTAPLHEQALTAIKAANQAGRPLWVSRQVLREFVATRTRPQAFAKPSPIQVVIERVRYLEQHFQVADDSAAVTGQLLELMGNYPIGGKQVHDANIVSTMLVYGIPCLLTHNTKDFERFGDIVTVEGIA